ncbi:MAG: hypothetical protein K8F27_04045, partial [Sulfuricellaceae bacterium]|nr:hypothetical protein [Sulfuricellaceae bacterium]
VAKVDFYQGSTLLGTATQAPYAFTWTNAPAGTYTLTAVATDNRGAATTSAPVAIILNAPPTVSLTAPADKAVLFAPTDVAIAALVADSDGSVAKVEFYQGQTLLGTVTQAPYAFTWANAPAGSYTLSAKATDNWGASTVSIPATVTVDIPPSVSLSAAPVGDLVAPTSLVLTAQATDPDGTVAKVEFYQGQTLLGTVTQPPYVFTWDKVAAGTYRFTAKATDNLGGSTVSTPVPMTVVPNQPPQVSLTAPQAGQAFAAPASISLAANAFDADGTIAKVDFYQGTTPLGSATQAPYAYAWAKVAVGTYSITAQATDNKGATTVSSPLTVTVSPAVVKGVFYIYPDQLGTPRVVTDASNKVIWKYDPLGEPFGTSAPDEDPDGDGLRFTLNLRFPGQYFDAETGLNYNYLRDGYDPATGRYTQSDPIGLQGGINTYTYVGGNPLLYADPSGLTPLGAAIGGRVGSWVGGAAGETLNPAGGGIPGAVIGGMVGSAVGDAVSNAMASAAAANSSSSSTSDYDRSIWQPDKKAGLWICKARADCNDNEPGNCPDDPKHRFAFGGGTSTDLGIARNIAKANATANLQCQPKHVSCKCTGPKGERYSGGC